MNDVPEDFVPIATFVSAVEASAAKLALEAEGIACFLKDDNVVGMYSIAAAGLGYIKLLVTPQDAERARHALDTPFRDWPTFSTAEPGQCRQCGQELDDRLDECRHCGAPRRLPQPPATTEETNLIRDLRQPASEETRRQADNPYAAPRSTGPASESTDEEDPSGNAAGHARCAGCGRARVAVCPFCQTSGSRFRPADFIPSERPPHLLICPICDEPFQPSYLRTCEWCGHDAGDGIEAPNIVRPFQTEPLNWRVMAVGLGGVTIIAALVIYFARLLS